ncbi:MAG: M28 family peptidase [Pseudomonadota bacterium]
MVVLLALLGCLSPSTVEPPAPYVVTRAALAAHVEFLADDRLAGRLPGTAGDRIATDYIAEAFADVGADPLLDDWFQPLRLVTREETRNVIAVVPGRAVPDEYVLFVAHHDAQGQCGDPSAADRICNGAVDNASGIALLIELARLFAEAPAARSIIFLASAAEERGLLGAKAFVAEPPVPLSSIRAAIGLDTLAARGYTRDVGLLGEGLTTLDDMAASAAAGEGRRLVGARDAQGFYARSDHFVFAEAGVPAVMFSGIFAPANGGLTATPYYRNRYHSPADDADAGIDYSGVQADAGMLLNFARAIADAETAPGWTRNAPYRRR